MLALNVLIPRHPVPQLDLPLLDRQCYSSVVMDVKTFRMLVFYRGLHCPLCAKYLMELEKLHDDFERRGVSPLAISSDNAERTAEMAKKINARN